MAPPTLPERIGGRHRDRLAVVYVRQSTLQQVGRHPESTRLQYALAERIPAIGVAHAVRLLAEGEGGARGRAHQADGAIVGGLMAAGGDRLVAGDEITFHVLQQITQLQIRPVSQITMPIVGQQDPCRGLVIDIQPDH